jgi:adenine-specific DNA methylase
LTLVLGNRAIENGFPIEFVSQLAEHESWRKEVYRPVYYIHKWWAKRLGSVFRSIIIASCVDKHEDVSRLFYEPAKFEDKVVFDPFMGSGTSVGEAVKLGCKVIGADINPVSTTMVRSFLSRYSKEEVQHTFDKLSSSAGVKIRALYSTVLDSESAEILYYFWVRTVDCPKCNHAVELFKDRIFIKHAYPKRYPESKATCPSCGEIGTVRYDATKAVCGGCKGRYNPQEGNVHKSQVTCPKCSIEFRLIDALRDSKKLLGSKMYAKMVLSANGEKKVFRTDKTDELSYKKAEESLESLRGHVPEIEIRKGHNTDQVLNYNYKYWHQMFNARQLYSIAILSAEIKKIEDPDLRRLFACLLSGVLEFNNMFASFKGEGTGAVRHMFAHHILKPELTPLEANIWGTQKSSGSFSTLFKSRILRALEYKDSPFELKLRTKKNDTGSQKVFGLSKPLNRGIISDFGSFGASDAVYIRTGDSASTDIKTGSVDLVITDPPFFDNVHYSELADFFYVWLRKILAGKEMEADSTRSLKEVQSTSADEFCAKLTSVFSECNRVLRDDGLLVFTYHHSRMEGWLSVYKSISDAGFLIVKTHPVKSEMSVSVPIQQSSAPISYDLIMVCRKSDSVQTRRKGITMKECIAETIDTINRLRRSSLEVTKGDMKVILMGSILSHMSRADNSNKQLTFLQHIGTEMDSLVAQVARQ